MAFNYKQKENTIFGFRSEDGGKIWKTVDTENLANNKTGSVYGHIFQLPEGRHGVVGHYRPGCKPYEQGIWMSFSDDNGLSWSSAKCITEGNFVEPAIIYTHRGFIGLLRTEGGRDFYTLAFSKDGENWNFKANAFGMEQRGQKYPSPFLIHDPQDKKRLLAFSSVRHEDITLYSADMNSAETLIDLKWNRVGTLVKWGGPGEEHADWTYPWMTHLGNGKWMCAFYYGRRRGKCDIYGIDIQL